MNLKRQSGSCVAVNGLRFHQKYLHLCFEDERKFNGFGTTWGRKINNIMFA